MQRIKSTIGQVIRERRDQMLMNQREMGDMLGVTEFTICRWEQGKHEPSRMAMQNILKKLEVGLEEVQVEKVRNTTGHSRRKLKSKKRNH